MVTPRATVILLVATLVCLSAGASVALAYDELSPTYPDVEPNHGDPGSTCYSCHTPDCGSCHSIGLATARYRGPHGSYTTSTNKCPQCHDVHGSVGNRSLLPADTVKGACETCHDGTGGRGVYGAIAARLLTVGGGHRIDVTASIPGADRLTGGAATGTFTGENAYLTCSDCHSPHDARTVAAFYGDRARSFRPGTFGLARSAVSSSNKLLLREPTGAGFEATEYGAMWCLTCHGGRDSTGPVHNHPVESTSAVSPATPYIYRSLPVADSDSPTGVTVLGQLGGRPSVRGSGNRGYLMPYPRTAQQTGHYPLCQQCHEDSRDVGDLTAAGLADAEVSTITNPDGATATDNPRFQNFPHETINDYMVVEIGDDLCMNCHPVSLLP